MINDYRWLNMLVESEASFSCLIEQWIIAALYLFGTSVLSTQPRSLEPEYFYYVQNRTSSVQSQLSEHK